jgi:hypothetical protein
MPDLQFIAVKTDCTRREKELLISEVRAHAARTRRGKGLITSQLSTSAGPVFAQPPRKGPSFHVVQMRARPENDNSQPEEPVFDPWQLSRGYRHEPFEVIPGSNEGIAPIALNFRKCTHR